MVDRKGICKKKQKLGTILTEIGFGIVVVLKSSNSPFLTNNNQHINKNL